MCQGDHGVRFPEGEQLWKDITTRYDSAQGMKASSFTDTVTEVVEDGGFLYILKIACRLRDKPKAPKDSKFAAFYRPDLKLPQIAPAKKKEKNSVATSNRIALRVIMMAPAWLLTAAVDKLEFGATLTRVSLRIIVE